MHSKELVQFTIAFLFIGYIVFGGLVSTNTVTAPTSFEMKEGQNLEDHNESDIREGVGDLLPDLTLLPPYDISIRREGARILLVFSTTYYNVGTGELELVADLATSGIAEDIERVVFQRIYQKDGSYRDKSVGTFLWHEEHLHYHYSNFVDYKLTIPREEQWDVSHDHSIHSHEHKYQVSEKATFCVRDVTRVEAEIIEVREIAQYRVCGKYLQGVSVGWGDTYFNTYADQNLDITNIPSGTYTLSFYVNPLGILEEVSRENNLSSAEIVINKEEGTVSVRMLHPTEVPLFEHVHVEQNV